ncbi:3-phosphoshikimate 1-carboxyvinyltransferase [Paenibacillus graminis]|uniref:3-phosphoshikimate 1-carboxyvinyltransferase n=1 Tax=Paenibacillus graminis TaxID=189425 RepID=UPI0004AC72D9|nr:3-phosphoshikimate 1-carboxyvinyltransferase [Paenibacillus graminis]
MALVRNRVGLPAKCDLQIKAKREVCSFEFHSVPGDKSISQRAIVLNAIAEGKGTVYNVLRSRDIESCIAILRQLGVTIAWNGDDLSVHGKGLRGLQAPAGRLEVGNTATSARLILSVLAGQSFAAELGGNALLSARPMDWVVQPLTDMGAVIEYLGTKGCLPLRIQGASPLSPIEMEATVFSAQEKSALLFAGLYAEGITCYRQRCQSRDHTERLMHYFGIDIQSDNDVTFLKGGKAFSAKDVMVPGDLSSAAFLLAAYAIRRAERKGSLLIKGVGVNPTRSGFTGLLAEMGLHLTLQAEAELISGEPIADIYCTPGTRLSSVLAEGNGRIQSLIDEVPLLAAVSAFAEGDTVIRDCGELRDKDTNRIQTTAGVLRAFGVETSCSEDEMVIHGGRRLSPAIVDSCGDHRIAMTAAVLASSLDEPSIIRNCGCINVSYPGFVEDLSQFADIDVLYAE